MPQDNNHKTKPRYGIINPKKNYLKKADGVQVQEFLEEKGMMTYKKDLKIIVSILLKNFE